MIGLSTKLESTREALEDVVLSKTKDLNSKLDLMKRELARSQRAAPERQQRPSSWTENQKGDMVMSEDINAKLDTLKVKHNTLFNPLRHEILGCTVFYKTIYELCLLAK